MAKFTPAIEKILPIEGGYQDMKEDRGNYSTFDAELVGTNYGISAPFAEEATGRKWTKEEMFNLSLENAKFLYYWWIWKPVYGHIIEDQQIAEFVFDTAVNHGIGNAAKLVQESINLITPNPIKVDGVFGPITVGKINRTYPPELFNTLWERRMDFYQRIVKNRPSQKKFIKGWKNRLKEFEYIV